MINKWKKEEVEFITKFGPGITISNVYASYKKKFPKSKRTLNAVKKKLDSLSAETVKDEPILPLEVVDTFSTNKYAYSESEDEYYISMKNGLLKVPGEEMRNLISSYSNLGAAQTINMIAGKFGKARHEVINVLRALGKTHDSAPFTDEDIETMDEDVLVSDIVRKKEHKIITKADKVLQAALEKDAENWRKVNKTIEEVFDKKDYSLIPSRPRFNLAKPKTDFDVVLYHTDAHVGKLAEGWSLKDTSDLILGTAERALQHAVQYGQPRRIITGIGGDWANIDTPSHTTTKGTRQTNNSNWFELMDAANQITLDLIQLMSDVAPVLALTVAGNHDRMWSILAGSWLSKMFEKSDRVTVEKFKHRHYVRAGHNMMMFTHGDLAKPSDFPSIMAAEAPEMWGTTFHRYAYHGHRHHELTREAKGVTLVQMPSIAPTDDWHEGEGYVGTRRALTAHLHDYEAGRVANFNIAVKDKKILG